MLEDGSNSQSSVSLEINNRKGIPMIDSVKKHVENGKEHQLHELISWLKIPSISTLSEYKKDVGKAASWVRDKIERIGFPVAELIEGAGHPLVYAEWLGLAGQPTLLIYGHYDVQPVDPLEEWQSPPFDPTIENNNIFARGASDNKGQIMLVLSAIEGWIKAEGNPPVNIKVLLEGEEEAGGESIACYVPDNRKKLEADAVLICDTHMNSIEQPSIINGLRGILYTEIAVFGPKKDLHSGSYGGVAPNPIHAICLLIGRLKGEDGKINIPGIYDHPENIQEEEKEYRIILPRVRFERKLDNS